MRCKCDSLFVPVCVRFTQVWMIDDGQFCGDKINARFVRITYSCKCTAYMASVHGLVTLSLTRFEQTMATKLPASQQWFRWFLLKQLIYRIWVYRESGISQMARAVFDSI